MSDPADDRIYERRDDALLAAEARMRRVITMVLEERKDADIARMRVAIEEISKQQREAMWDRMGQNVSSDEGLLRVKNILNGWEKMGINLHDDEKSERAHKAFEWLFKSVERSNTAGNRLLALLSVLIGILGLLGGFVDWVLNWRAAHHG